MFPARYFAPRHFAARYFPKAGATAARVGTWARSAGASAWSVLRSAGALWSDGRGAGGKWN